MSCQCIARILLPAYSTSHGYGYKEYKLDNSKMSETPDITNLFRTKHDSWDPDSELGSIIYLTREPITKIPTKAIVIASNEVMKSRGNNCKIVRRDPHTKTRRSRTGIEKTRNLEMGQHQN